MESVHKRVRIRIDGQHRERVHPTVLGVLPARPQARDAKRVTTDVRNACGNGLARAPVRLVNRLGRNDAALIALVGIPEAGLLCGCLAAAVVGGFGDGGVGGPVRHQTKEAIQGLQRRHGLVTHIGARMPADKCAQVARPHVELCALNGWLCAEFLEEFLPFLHGLVMTAHCFYLPVTILYA